MNKTLLLALLAAPLLALSPPAAADHALVKELACSGILDRTLTVPGVALGPYDLPGAEAQAPPADAGPVHFSGFTITVDPTHAPRTQVTEEQQVFLTTCVVE